MIHYQYPNSNYWYLFVVRTGSWKWISGYWQPSGEQIRIPLKIGPDQPSVKVIIGLTVFNFRFMKNAGYFSNTRNIPLLPRHHTQEQNFPGHHLEELKKSIAQYKEDDLLCKISALREINEKSMRSTNKVLGRLDTNYIGRSSKKQSRDDTFKFTSKDIRDKAALQTCTTTDDQNVIDKDFRVKDLHDSSRLRAANNEEILEIGMPLIGFDEKQSVNNKNREASAGSTDQLGTASEEEMAKVMEKFLAISSRSSLEKSVSEPCISSLTPSSQWTGLTSSKEQIEKRKICPMQSRGTQTNRVLYVEIPVDIDQEDSSSCQSDNLHEEVLIIWPDENDLKPAKKTPIFFDTSFHSSALRFARYNRELLQGKLEEMSTIDQNLKTVTKIPDVLQALNISFVLDKNSCRPILLRDTYYCDTYAGLMNESGKQIKVSVRLYKKIECHWSDILKEASLYKMLEKTMTVPRLFGITFIQMSDIYWSAVVVCNMIGSTELGDQPSRMITLAHLLHCSKEEDDNQDRISRTTWLRICKDITEKMARLHQMHVVPFDVVPDNVLLQEENNHWQPYFTDFLHAVHDQGKSILQIATQGLPLRSLTMLSFQYSEWQDSTILRRKRNINTKTLGYLFEEISKVANIPMKTLIRQCKQENSNSRPSFSFILEKLGEIARKCKILKNDKTKMNEIEINSNFWKKIPISCCTVTKFRRNTFS